MDAGEGRESACVGNELILSSFVVVSSQKYLYRRGMIKKTRHCEGGTTEAICMITRDCFAHDTRIAMVARNDGAKCRERTPVRSEYFSQTMTVRMWLSFGTVRRLFPTFLIFSAAIS